MASLLGVLTHGEVPLGGDSSWFCKMLASDSSTGSYLAPERERLGVTQLWRSIGVSWVERPTGHIEVVPSDFVGYALPHQEELSHVRTKQQCL